jgi:hypothetical protein
MAAMDFTICCWFGIGVEGGQLWCSMWVAGRARRCRAPTYPRKPMRRCLK